MRGCAASPLGRNQHQYHDLCRGLSNHMWCTANLQCNGVACAGGACTRGVEGGMRFLLRILLPTLTLCALCIFAMPVPGILQPGNVQSMHGRASAVLQTHTLYGARSLTQMSDVNQMGAGGAVPVRIHDMIPHVEARAVDCALA